MTTTLELTTNIDILMTQLKATLDKASIIHSLLEDNVQALDNTKQSLGVKHDKWMLIDQG